MFGIGGCEEVWSSIFWAQRRSDLTISLSRLALRTGNIFSYNL